MTQYVLLSADQTSVVTLFHSPQRAQGNYAEIADGDARYVAYLATQSATQAVADKIAAGASVVSASTPALNGTYSISAAAQQNISGIAAGIAARSRVPGGETTFNYFDAAGAAHAFTAQQFLDFASAIEDYVYALVNGGSPSLPLTID